MKRKPSIDNPAFTDKHDAMTRATSLETKLLSMAANSAAAPSQRFVLVEEVVSLVRTEWEASDSLVAHIGAAGLDEALEEARRGMASLVEAGFGRSRVSPTITQAAQELFACALALGQQLRTGLVHALPSSGHVDLALAAVSDLLDALEPHVTRADIAMRRVLLDGEALHAAAAWASSAS